MTHLYKKLLGLGINSKQLIRINAPVLLTAMSVSGLLTTSYLVGRASWDAAILLDKEEHKRLLNKEKLIVVMPLYIPAGFSFSVTVASMIAATSISTRKTAAIAAAYALSEKALIEYKEKVIDTFGEKKAVGIKDAIAQEKVKNNPPSNAEVILASPGNVLCYDVYTGRYFHSDSEQLRKSENTINAKIFRELYVPLDELFDLWGLPHTKLSGTVGWSSGKLVEFIYSTTLAKDGQPCITVEYSYLDVI